jgi:thiosulfate/3-mercaptopyruvate sulfurtransferase
MSPTLPHPIISVDDLAARLADPRLRICDVRWKLGEDGYGRRAYEQGHLPDAIFIDLDTDLADPAGFGAPGRHPLPSPPAFARRLETIGIADDSFVVAYDDAGGSIAARLWWMLDDLGHRDVAVLDGGNGAWTAAGLELTTDPPPRRVAFLHLRDHWSRTIGRDALRSRLGALVLLDARAPERYRGETEPVDPAPGHIPTALSLPAGAMLEDGRFRSPEAIAERFRSIGADGSRGEVVVSCGSGVTACHHALTMRAAGLPDPILYPGSYSDWSRSDYPVKTGDEPGARG